MKNTKIKLLRAETGVCSLEDVFCTFSCDESLVLDGLSEGVKLRIRAFRWWMWFKCQRNENLHDWKPFRSEDLQRCFEAYDPAPPCPDATVNSFA